MFLCFAPQMKSTAADSIKMIYKITGAGADQPPKGLFTVEKISGLLWVTKSLDREETEEYIVSDLKNLDFKHNMLKQFEFACKFTEVFCVDKCCILCVSVCSSQLMLQHGIKATLKSLSNSPSKLLTKMTTNPCVPRILFWVKSQKGQN